MLTDSHIFERASRLPASAVDALSIDAWEPPIIDERGHLIQAKPRDAEPVQRHGMGASGSGNDAVADQSAEDREPMGFEEGKALGLEAGHKEGFESGHKEGYDSGMAEAAGEIRQQDELLAGKLTDLNKLLSSLSNSLNEQDYQLEQALLNIALAIAKTVIRQELATQPEQIMSVIKEAIAALPPSRDNIKIYCNSSDAKLIKQASAFGGENWALLTDDDLHAGGCKIITDQSVVDYSLSTRIQSAINALLENPGAQISSQHPDFDEAPEPALGRTVEASDTDADEDGDT